MAWDFVLSEDANSWFQILLFGALLLSSLFTVILLTLPSQYDPYMDKPLVAVNANGEELQTKGKEGKEKNHFRQGRTTQVVVLGDIGRSPRMQYHALSLAKHGVKVYLIGYHESEIHPDIEANPLIHIIALVPAPSLLHAKSKILFPVFAPLKALWQARTLYRALGYRTEPARYLLVQNPPSIPTLAIATLISFLRNTELIIDWHNFGYSILALKLGASHPLVLISSLYESIFARFASQHITVTNAMGRILRQSYGAQAVTLHDRPATLFRPISKDERKAFLSRLPETAQYAQDLTSPSPGTPWKLLVTSTSWTPDEDFSLLLSALTRYSSDVSSLSAPQTGLPNILAIITGKGPLKEHYLAHIRALNQANKLQNVVVTTAWLTPQDYALLLGAADLGVSLHTSSSGVDLPMKVVDMFGAGLPVVGWGKFEAWPELVQEGVNGKGFESGDQLAEQLVELFGGDGETLGKLREGAMRESKRRWDGEWDRIGGSIFKLV